MQYVQKTLDCSVRSEQQLIIPDPVLISNTSKSKDFGVKIWRINSEAKVNKSDKQYWWQDKIADKLLTLMFQIVAE